VAMPRQPPGVEDSGPAWVQAEIQRRMRASPASSGGRHARRERGVDADDAVEDVESPARGLLRPDADRPDADRHIARPAGPGQGAEAVGPPAHGHPPHGHPAQEPPAPDGPAPELPAHDVTEPGRDGRRAPARPAPRDRTQVWQPDPYAAGGLRPPPAPIVPEPTPWPPPAPASRHAGAPPRPVPPAGDELSSLLPPGAEPVRGLVRRAPARVRPDEQTAEHPRVGAPPVAPGGPARSGPAGPSAPAVPPGPPAPAGPAVPAGPAAAAGPAAPAVEAPLAPPAPDDVVTEERDDLRAATSHQPRPAADPHSAADPHQDYDDYDDEDDLDDGVGSRVLWSADAPPADDDVDRDEQTPGTGSSAALPPVLPDGTSAVEITAPYPTTGQVDAASGRVRVVLSERRQNPRSVRTVVDVQDLTSVGDLLRSNLIGTQLGLALRVAAVAVLTLGSLPALFALFPEIGRIDVLGLRLPWLLLGVLVYPFLLLLGWWHTRSAEKVEQEFADHVQD